MKTPMTLFVTLLVVVAVAALIDFRLWWSFDDKNLFSGAKPAFTNPIDEGKYYFQQKCSTCHTVGGGTLVGPDLKDVLKRREKKWVERFVMEPDKVIASGDQTATALLKEFKNVPMPNLGLTQKEIDPILAFFEGPKEPDPSGKVEVVVKGDVLTGQKYFMGSIPFANGGIACMSCHTVNGTGRLGGGTVGPDLTQVVKRFGEEGVGGLLKGLPYPTMAPVYNGKPLTKEEQEHLKSFFVAANANSPADNKWNVVLAGSGGFLFLLALVPTIWWKRSRGVRKNLVGGKS